MLHSLHSCYPIWNPFYFFFIYFYQLEANYFTILQWLLPYIDMNQPWIYMCSPSEAPSTSLPIPSLWAFPVHQPQALISCIQPGLVICFILDNIHVSMLFSQIIPPSPSPRVQKSVLYICVSFSVLHIGLLLPSF